jgi:MFS family permease
MLMFFDAISFFVSAVAAFFIKIPQKLPEKSAGFREVINHFKRDTGEGFRYVWASKGLRALIFMAAFINFFVAPIGVLLPFYIEDTLKATPDWFGYFLALLGGGALIGYLIMGVIKLPGRFRGLLVLSSIASFAVIIGLLGVVKSVYAALVLSFFMGMFVGIANLNISVVLQATTPTEIRGRVFGLLSTVGGGLAPISMGLAGVILDLTGKNLSLIFGFSGGITLLFTAMLVFNRDFKQFLAYDAKTGPAAS